MSDDNGLMGALYREAQHNEIAEAAYHEIERLRKALEQCIFERDTWRNLYDEERGGADYNGDDRYLHEPAGEVPKGKTRRL